jgi:hypothetical protein
MDEVPPYLPWGSTFRVPKATDIMEHVRQHAELARTNTMHRVSSAFELADMARLQTGTVIRRASSFSMLSGGGNLREVYVRAAEQQEQVERSWQLAHALQALVLVCYSLAAFPYVATRAVMTAMWAILSRPDEAKWIAELAARDARQRGEAKAD